MKLGWIISFLSCLFLLQFRLQAQTDSIAMHDSIPEVEIEGFALSKTVSGGSTTIEVMPVIGITNNLVGILNYSTAPIVRSYGAGASSSLSFRGMGPNHSQVLWNGLVLNSPMLGQADLSIVPGFFFDKVEISTGSSMTNANSDAIGGVVNLISALPTDSLQWKVVASGGSYGSIATGFQFNKLYKKFNFDTRFLLQQAENDIRYKDATETDLPIKRMTNADFKQIGIQELVAINLNKKWNAQVVANYLTAYRHIAPSIVSATSGTEAQYDENIRAVGVLKGQIKTNGMLMFRTGFIRDFIRYQDTLLLLEEPSVFSASRSLLQYKQGLKKGELQASLMCDYDQAKIDNYGSTAKRLRTAASLLFQQRLNKIHFGQALLKVDGSEQFGFYFLPSFGVNISVNKKLDSTIKLEYSRSLKMPTFNDLYWNPGGNLNLMPELSNTIEETFSSLIIKKKRIEMSTTISAFYTDVTNWILWTPGQSYWSPSNVWRVGNAGFESTLGLKLNLEKVKLTAQVGYFNQNPIVLEDKKDKTTVKNTLPYVPKNQMNANLNILVGKWSIAFNHQYQGKRFTTVENAFYLPYYQLTNAVLGYTFQAGEYAFVLNAECRNLTNADYYSLAWRPMPGRWFQFSLQISPK